MRRLLQALLLALASIVSASVSALSCTSVIVGNFDSSGSAIDACELASGVDCRVSNSGGAGLTSYATITKSGGSSYTARFTCDSYIGDWRLDDATGVTYFYYYDPAGCPEETSPTDEGLCVGPGNCDSAGDPAGSVWNSTLEQCVCPEGSTDVFGPDASYSCLSQPPECDPADAIGYANDIPVCDFSDECGSGASGGMVGNEWVCLPDSGCGAGETYINGSCIGPDNMTDDPTTEFDESDTDGDGTPDSNDGDMDGDGTPNSQDGDMDGDGIPNEDDPSPMGEEGEEGSASASGGCEEIPQCTGDPQECALIKQQWYAMCYSEEYQSNADGFYTPESGEDLDSRFEGALSDFKDRIEASELVSGFDSFFNFAGGGSCPVYSVSTWIFDITFDQWCGNEMPWGAISGILFAVSLLIAGRIVVS